VLELPLTGDIEAAAIRAAYRRRSLATHPDHGGAPEAFVRVHDAYERLGAGQERSPGGAAFDDDSSDRRHTTRRPQGDEAEAAFPGGGEFSKERVFEAMFDFEREFVDKHRAAFGDLAKNRSAAQEFARDRVDAWFERAEWWQRRLLRPVVARGVKLLVDAAFRAFPDMLEALKTSRIQVNGQYFDVRDFYDEYDEFRASKRRRQRGDANTGTGSSTESSERRRRRPPPGEL